VMASAPAWTMPTEVSVHPGAAEICSTVRERYPRERS
jgi:hypothetical protein